MPASYVSSAEKTHTIHQLLLVLNYLFVSAVLPEDKGALWKIIYRSVQDWEQSFVLQYSQLQSWLKDIRAALTDSQGLHTVSFDDLEMQIRYILFLLGQHALPEPSFLQAYFERPFGPYRPFGVGASVALICYAFMGISATDIRGYESAEIWARDESFFSLMLARSRKSPIFSAELSIEQLQVILGDLQRAFQNEEVRVASMKPRKLNISDRMEAIDYYIQGFLSLDPLLLPKISLVALGTKPLENCTRLELATLVAKIFYDKHPVQILDEGFKKIPDIMRSKPDRVLVTEMFHVKAWQETLQNATVKLSSGARDVHSDELYIKVFHAARASA